jgi:hypothetical protein
MPSQLLVNQEFLNDDLDISVGDLDRAFIDTPSFGLPSSATKIVRLPRRIFLTLIASKISQNAAARPNHGSAVQTSTPKYVDPSLLYSPLISRLVILFGSSTTPKYLTAVPKTTAEAPALTTLESELQVIRLNSHHTVAISGRCLSQAWIWSH